MEKNKLKQRSKTILVATDFSSASKNAIKYAAELAHSKNLPLHLVHVYLPPIAVAEGQLLLPSLGQLKKINDSKLQKLINALSKKYNNQLNVSFSSKCGMPADEIKSFAEAKNARLLIMGLQGASGVKEFFIGSTTTEVLRNSVCPVLTVGHKVKYRPIKKIVFACDYKENYTSTLLEPLKKLAKEHEAEIEILHVFKKSGAIPTLTQAIEGLKIENAFKGIKHKFVAAVNSNVTDGISYYAKATKGDIIVMVPRERGFIQKIFTTPNSKVMAFHSSIPLLTIKDLK
jgi:nucleotide-binding universal stress UspA family protein